MEKTISITTDIATTVSVEDYEEVVQSKWNLAGGNGSKGSKGKYLSRSERIDGRWTTTYLHRLVARRMGLLEDAPHGKRGEWSRSVDHINGNKLDNRRENLRIATRAEQMTNPHDRLRSTNTSGYRGVSYDAKNAKWSARVMVAYKNIHLGRFATAEEAGAARAQWDKEHSP